MGPSMMDWLKKSGGTLAVFALVAGAIFALVTLFTNFGRFLSLLVQFSWYLSIASSAALFISLLAPGLKKVKTPGALQLLKDIILYIPCLLIDFADNIAGTKKSIWILLLIELVALALYFGIPYLMKSKYLKIGTVLSDEPQYLNKQTNVDMEAYKEVLEKSRNTLHYAVTADIWINPQPTSTSPAYTKDTNVLAFGERVKVMYNGKEPRKLIIKAKDGKEEEVVVKPDIKLQKWIPIVLNYDHGTLDIFVDNKLVSSTQNVPYMTLDSIHGGAPNGIQGGIRDIRYFDKPLSANEIALLNLA